MKSKASAFSFVNRSFGNKLFEDTLSKNAFISDVIEPMLLVFGIVSNLVLIAIIFKKKRTESFRSHKPLRYLLIVILICDTWYLLSELNVKVFKFGTMPDLTSFNYFCQLHSYLYYFFAVLIEFSMLSANYIVACLVHLPKENKSSIDVYNDFYIKESENDSTNFDRGDFKTRSLRRIRRLFIRSNSAPVEKLPRGISVDNIDQMTGKNGKKATFTRSSLSAKPRATSFGRKNVNVEMRQAANAAQSRNTRTDNTSSVAYENETNRVKKSANSGLRDEAQTSAHLNKQISILEEINRRERLKQYRANANSIVYPLKIESDDTYFSLAIKEKFFIILNIFVCMYFLSFFLWIQGVEILDDGRGGKFDDSMSGLNMATKSVNQQFTATSGNWNLDMMPSMNNTDFDKEFEELFAEQMPAMPAMPSFLTASQSTSVPLTVSPRKRPSASSFRFSSDSLQICKTYKFATAFLRYFLFFLSFLRLITLCINLVITVCFCVRFKKDLVQALFSSFKKHDDAYYAKSKLINFKSFKFTLITDCEQPVPANGPLLGGQNGKKSAPPRKPSHLLPNPSDSSRQESNMDLHNSHPNELSSTGNSHCESAHMAHGGAFRRFKKDRIRLLIQNQNKMYYSHLHFVRHHITTIAFYSILISFGVINEINSLYLDWSAANSRSNVVDSRNPSDLRVEYMDILDSNNENFSFESIRARMNVTKQTPAVRTTTPTIPGTRTFTMPAVQTTQLTLKSKSVFERIIAMESDMKDSLNIQTLINLTTILAHSTKLLIYLVFSAHIKCFVKLNRPEARNQVGDEV